MSTLVIDTFEGQDLLDLNALYDNNVRHILVRLGCYNIFGLNGNRKDKLFDQQWDALAVDGRFKTGVYIPYNPWKTWQYNIQWLIDNLPEGCETVELDVENYRPYSPKTYGAEVAEFIKHLPSFIQLLVYTGEGYLSYLSPWPAAQYSWAQYPYALRPSDTLRLTWDSLRNKLFSFSGPSNESRCPGRVLLWQFTGDKLVLPGSSKGLDVYVWLGTDDELNKFFSSSTISIPDPLPEPQSRYTGSVKLSTIPNLNVRKSAMEGAVIGHLSPGEKFQGDTSQESGNGLWIHITQPLDGWIAGWLTDYADNQEPTPKPIESAPAIPGPFYVLSRREGGDTLGAGQPGKLDAYPATIHTRGSLKGNLLLGSFWLSFLKQITKYYDKLWVRNEGWGNNGEVGRVQPVVFSHNMVWVNKVNPDGWYEIESYHLSDVLPASQIIQDRYRFGTITVDYVSGHEDTGGVIASDRMLPYIVITKDSTEVLRIDPRYLESQISIPFTCKVKTNGANLNVHSSVGGPIITTLKNQTPVTVFKLQKSGVDIWGLTTEPGSVEGWIVLSLTDAKV